jgi:hypothetical protein
MRDSVLIARFPASVTFAKATLREDEESGANKFEKLPETARLESFSSSGSSSLSPNKESDFVSPPISDRL